MSAKPTTPISELSPTDRNLWQAIVSEALAHLTYTAYAHKAMEDGLPEVARVFQEVAGAETIHGINHLRVSGDIADTESNLTKVIAGETREYSRTYPRMIQQAHDEGRTDAVRAFTLAMEREKVHQTAFTNALDALHSAPARDGNTGRIAQTLSEAGAVEPAMAAASGAVPSGEDVTPDLDTYITAAMEVDREAFRVANLGRLREVVFGAQDGIISTVALTTSVAAAVGDKPTVLVAGLAAITAGIISMAAGAYLGSRAEQDVRDGEIAREARELAEKPAEEFAKLVILLQREGQTYENAVHLANDIAQDQTLWLNTLLEKELGITPDIGGSPVKDALVMGVSFGLSAILPIAPYFFLDVNRVTMGLSIGLSLAGLFALGLTKGRIVRKSPLLQGLEILGIGTASAALGYALGELLPRVLGF